MTLCYRTGEERVFTCVNVSGRATTNIVQKQLDTSSGGLKRLNFLIPRTGITNISGKQSDCDIILSDKDMDEVFNLVSVGTEVEIN